MDKISRARTQESQSYQAVEMVSIKDLFKGNPASKAGLEMLAAYHAAAVERSGIPPEQIDSFETMTKHISKKKQIAELNSPGSLNIFAAKRNLPTEPGFEIVGGYQTVDHDTKKFGKVAMHLEQKWGVNQEEAIAGVMDTAREKGFQYLILEVSNEDLRKLEDAPFSHTIFTPTYRYFQPNGDSPVADLHHVYVQLHNKIMRHDIGVPIDVIMAYYESWAGKNDKAVALMRENARTHLGTYNGKNTELFGFNKTFEDDRGQRLR